MKTKNKFLLGALSVVLVASLVLGTNTSLFKGSITDMPDGYTSNISIAGFDDFELENISLLYSDVFVGMGKALSKDESTLSKSTTTNSAAIADKMDIINNFSTQQDDNSLTPEAALVQAVEDAQAIYDQALIDLEEAQAAYDSSIGTINQKMASLTLNDAQAVVDQALIDLEIAKKTAQDAGIVLEEDTTVKDKTITVPDYTKTEDLPLVPMKTLDLNGLKSSFLVETAKAQVVATNVNVLLTEDVLEFDKSRPNKIEVQKSEAFNSWAGRLEPFEKDSVEVLSYYMKVADAGTDGIITADDTFEAAFVSYFNLDEMDDTEAYPFVLDYASLNFSNDFSDLNLPAILEGVEAGDYLVVISSQGSMFGTEFAELMGNSEEVDVYGEPEIFVHLIPVVETGTYVPLANDIVYSTDRLLKGISVDDNVLGADLVIYDAELIDYEIDFNKNLIRSAVENDDDRINYSPVYEDLIVAYAEENGFGSSVWSLEDYIGVLKANSLYDIEAILDMLDVEMLVGTSGLDVGIYTLEEPYKFYNDKIPTFNFYPNEYDVSVISFLKSGAEVDLYDDVLAVYEKLPEQAYNAFYEILNSAKRFTRIDSTIISNYLLSNAYKLAVEDVMSLSLLPQIGSELVQDLAGSYLGNYNLMSDFTTLSEVAEDGDESVLISLVGRQIDGQQVYEFYLIPIEYIDAPTLELSSSVEGVDQGTSDINMNINESVSFTASSTVADTSDWTYVWDYEDSESLDCMVEGVPFHEFSCRSAASGTVTVKVTATVPGYGEIESNPIQITISDVVTPDVTVTITSTPAADETGSIQTTIGAVPVVFTRTMDPAVSSVTLAWSFGAGNCVETSDNPNELTCTPSAVENYTVSVVAADGSESVVDSNSIQVMVTDPSLPTLTLSSDPAANADDGTDNTVVELKVGDTVEFTRNDLSLDTLEPHEYIWILNVDDTAVLNCETPAVDPLTYTCEAVGLGDEEVSLTLAYDEGSGTVMVESNVILVSVIESEEISLSEFWGELICTELPLAETEEITAENLAALLAEAGLEDLDAFAEAIEALDTTELNEFIENTIDYIDATCPADLADSDYDDAEEAVADYLNLDLSSPLTCEITGDEDEFDPESELMELTYNLSTEEDEEINYEIFVEGEEGTVLGLIISAEEVEAFADPETMDWNGLVNRSSDGTTGAKLVNGDYKVVLKAQYADDDSVSCESKYSFTMDDAGQSNLIPVDIEMLKTTFQPGTENRASAQLTTRLKAKKVVVNAFAAGRPAPVKTVFATCNLDTAINCDLSQIKMEIGDIGAENVDNGGLMAGEYNLYWDGADTSHMLVPNGDYNFKVTLTTEDNEVYMAVSDMIEAVNSAGGYFAGTMPVGYVPFDGVPLASCNFADIAPNDPDYMAAQWACQAGIFMGSNGNMMMDEPLQRVDFIAVANRLAQCPATTYNVATDGNLGFWDLDSVISSNPNSWYLKEIKNASQDCVSKGQTINGYADGSIQILKQLTAAEMWKVIIEAAKNGDRASYVGFAANQNVSPWYADYQTLLISKGIYLPNASASMTRRDAIRLLFDMYNAGLLLR